MILKSSENLQASRAQEEGVPRQELRSVLLKWRYLTLFFGFCFTVATIAVVFLICCRYSDQTSTIVTRESEESQNGEENGLPPKTPLNLVYPEISSTGGLASCKVRFISRNEWGASPPMEPLTKLQHPVPYVIISHTATDFCKDQAECTFRVRFAQTLHIEARNWSDIGYNFLIGGDGYAYVGRSWDFVGDHSYKYNNRSIGISFIGTFNSVVPPKNQLDAARQIIELGVKTGKIAADYKLLGHRQISKTLSPGDALFGVIRTWPHWSPTP